jgi:hypothetical protein
MQELDEPWVLTAGEPAVNHFLDAQRREMGSGGHLKFALERYPDDLRFRLANVAHREWRLGKLISAPSYEQFARDRASEKSVTEPQTVQERATDVHYSQAQTALKALAGLPRVQQDYASLKDPVLSGEIEVRLGYLAYLSRTWEIALRHLALVPSLTDEEYLIYLSHFISGLIHLNNAHYEAAIVAFEQALNAVPRTVSASVHLAAALLLSSRQAVHDRASEVLASAFAEPSRPDPWRLYRHGDARLWASHMSRLRQVLRP